MGKIQGESFFGYDWLFGVLIIGSLLVSLPAASNPDRESDFNKGKKIANSLCLACHGPSGMSTNPIWPSLAGQKEGYLLKSLQAYKSGVRQDPLMTPQANTLTDSQIRALAVYYSSLTVKIVSEPHPPSDSEQ